jgi:hypothetical protein
MAEPPWAFWSRDNKRVFEGNRGRPESEKRRSKVRARAG